MVDDVVQLGPWGLEKKLVLQLTAEVRLTCAVVAADADATLALAVTGGALGTCSQRRAQQSQGDVSSCGSGPVRCPSSRNQRRSVRLLHYWSYQTRRSFDH